jgi:anti-sigma B factor antagonist
MNLDVRCTFAGTDAVVAVAGEVDVSNADILREAVDEALAAGGSVAVDMAAVPYIDSTGIGVLVGASHRADEAGQSFCLTGAQDNVVRILGMLGVDAVIDIVPAAGK